MSPTLLLATGNRNKGVEVQALLGPGVRVETLADHPGLELPPETGETFAANAILKAEAACAALGVPALADDSGLIVDALGGAPGVRSARYADGTDEDRWRKLLGALEDVADAERTARFACAMAFAVPGAETVVTEGLCEGRIARAPRGAGGFGYDPIFVLPDGRHMAELDREAKGAVSHRGAALRALAPTLAAHFSLETGRQSP